MQVDPIKPKLKAPGTKSLKLKYDNPPSSFAFNCDLRRYNPAEITAKTSAQQVLADNIGLGLAVSATAMTGRLASHRLRLMLPLIAFVPLAGPYYAGFQGTSYGVCQFMGNRWSNRHIVPLYGKSDRPCSQGRKFAHR